MNSDTCALALVVMAPCASIMPRDHHWRELFQRGSGYAEPRVLAGDGRAVQAVEWVIGGNGAARARLQMAQLARACARSAGVAVDVAVVPAVRRVRIMIADMDSTIIDGECIDEMADLVGCRAEVSAVTARAMAGEMDFATALRQRVAVLRGLPRKDIAALWRSKVNLRPGAQQLVRRLSAEGVTTILASGGFSIIADKVAAACGFDAVYSNRLEFDKDDHLLGLAGGAPIDAQRKADILRTHAAALGIEPSSATTAPATTAPVIAAPAATAPVTTAPVTTAPVTTIALGDGANDIPMLQCADLGIAFRAKEAVRQCANLAIDHCSLEAVLWCLGYATAGSLKQ